VRPAKVFILGGVTATGLKPVDVSAQLDRQMEAFDRAVQQAHGVLVRLERVRAFSTRRGPNEAGGATLEIVQRIRAEFDAATAVDSVLNQLLLIGLDRFGDTLDTNSGRQMPVRYVFRDFNADMQSLRDKCRAEAEKQFCDQRADLCSPAAPRNMVGSFVARSEERVLRPEGGANYLEWNDAPAGRSSPDRADPQLLGNLAIHMKGYYTLTPAAVYR
jgi:hypothetical protein